MVLPPAGPPPPSLPEGWKAHWSVEYKAWSYENIYTEEAVWEKPTQPVYPPQARAPLPPGPPPGYQASQQLAPNEKSGDPALLPSTMAAVSPSDKNPHPQPPQQQAPHGPATPTTPQTQQQYNPVPPATTASLQPNPSLIYGATPQSAQAPSPKPSAPLPNPSEAAQDYNPQGPQYLPQQTYPGYLPQRPSVPPPNTSSPQPTPVSTYGPTAQSGPGTVPQPAAPGLSSAEATRDFNPQGGQYPQEPTYPGYPPQQIPNPGYPSQQQYPPQPNYSPQPQYAQCPQQPQPVPAQKAGFMGMLQNKVGNKVPGGAGTLLGVGGGLLAGAVLEHEWDKHEDRERRRHHGGFGGLGGLMRGFGSDSGPPIVENVTINEDVYVDENSNSLFGF